MDTKPVLDNPADKILDNLDAFAGVVVQILTGGAYPLSSAQTRQLLQAEGALKESTAKVRELLEGGDDEDFIPQGMFSAVDPGTFGLSSRDQLLAQEREPLPVPVGEPAAEAAPLPTFSPFGRELVSLENAGALKSLLDLSIGDIEGLAKALKPAKPAKGADAPPAADPPLLSPPPAEPSTEVAPPVVAAAETTPEA